MLDYKYEKQWTENKIILKYIFIYFRCMTDSVMSKLSMDGKKNSRLQKSRFKGTPLHDLIVGK